MNLFCVFFFFLSFVANEKRTQQNPTAQQNLQGVGISRAPHEQALKKPRPGCSPGLGAFRGRSGAFRGRSVASPPSLPVTPKVIRLFKKESTNKTKHILN